MIWKIILPSNKTFTLPSQPKSYAELLDIVSQKYNSVTDGALNLKYLDSEDELINLTSEDDFDTAVITEKREKVHTLQIFVSIAKIEDSLATHSDNESSDHSTKESNSSMTNDQKIRRTRSRRVRTLIKSSEKTQTNPKKLLRSTSVPLKSQKSGVQNIRPFYGVAQEKLAKFRGIAEPIIRKDVKAADKLIEQKIDEKLEEETKALASIVLNVIKKVYGEEALMSASKKAVKDLRRLPRVCHQCKKRSAQMKRVCPTCFSQAFLNKTRTADNSPRQLVNTEALEQPTKKTSPVNDKNENSRVSDRKKTCPGFSSFISRRSHADNQTPNYKVHMFKGEIDDTIKLNCEQTYNIKFEVRNNGDVKWPEDVRLVCINGRNKGKSEKIPALEPDGKHEINLSLRASKNPGRNLSQWRITHGNGDHQKSFGESLFEEVYTVQDLKSEQSAEQSGFKKAESQESHEGRQEQDNDSISERKNSGESDGSYGKDFINIGDAKFSDKIRCHDDRVKCAKFLNDIFPGDLEEKVDFLYGFSEQTSINDVVEGYLIKLGKSKCQEKNSF